MVTRHPFYSTEFAGDFEDLSYYGGRWSFLYPRTGSVNLHHRWNKYSLPDHLYGPADPATASWQVTTATELMSAEEAASLSDGYGYEKRTPSPIWHAEVSGLLDGLGFTLSPFNDVGELTQYAGLPRPLITSTDADINTGLKAMLVLFEGTLSLVPNSTRTYWLRHGSYEDGAANSLLEDWGYVTAWEYKWTTPGVVETPSVDLTVGTELGEEIYSRFFMQTPFYWGGDMRGISIPAGDEVLPLTHMNGADPPVEITNRFHRLPNSRFWLITLPSDVYQRPDLSVEQNATAHTQMIKELGKVHIRDYEIGVKSSDDRKKTRWLRAWE